MKLVVNRVPEQNVVGPFEQRESHDGLVDSWFSSHRQATFSPATWRHRNLVRSTDSCPASWYTVAELLDTVLRRRKWRFECLIVAEEESRNLAIHPVTSTETLGDCLNPVQVRACWFSPMEATFTFVGANFPRMRTPAGKESGCT